MMPARVAKMHTLMPQAAHTELEAVTGMRPARAAGGPPDPGVGRVRLVVLQVDRSLRIDERLGRPPAS
jgi:hypothetical protein